MAKEFNKYSKENNLNITLNLILLTPENSTIFFNDYESTLESLFKKGSDKYDIIVFDVVYSQKFGPYFLDLKKYLPQNHIDLYNSNLLSFIGTYKNKIVGLVIIVIHF